jgi:hypothetical protein
MKKFAIALATTALLIAPVSISNAAPEKPKCSVSAIKSQNALDAAAKVAEKAAAKLIADVAKLKTQKAKAESDLKKAKDGKAAKVKTAGELKAKLLKVKNNLAAINKRIASLKGPALVKAQKDLEAALKEQAKLNELVAAANADTKEATEAATDATEEVTEVVEEIEVVETEVEEAIEIVEKKKSELAKAKGKCKR